MLLVVAESHGSSPGRAGYKMAVAANGELTGSIGGGVMEVSLVELAKSKVQGPKSKVIEQVHRRDAESASGMICSGRQTVIVTQVSSAYLETVVAIIDSIEQGRVLIFEISNLGCQITESKSDKSRHHFSQSSETKFVYQETIGLKEKLLIIGGGHCALALSELMSKLDFQISIFDDRPELNTIAKNEFANSITIIDRYENIGEHLAQGEDVYVVVMTLGYKWDALVIKQLIDHKFKYFGVLGSKAKMAMLMKQLRDEGIDAAKLDRIRTPIGIAINSRKPEEIAISIAAEIIQVKNADGVS